jgi:hypothetical protein
MTNGDVRDGRMRAFISYARADGGFAGNLRGALEGAGFQPLIDHLDIDAAEKWKNRSRSLIASCDSVVFVLTGDSAASPFCTWELAEAQRCGKRVIPVVPRALDDAAVPPELAGLNYIYFYPDPSVPESGHFYGQRKLEDALKAELRAQRGSVSPPPPPSQRPPPPPQRPPPPPPRETLSNAPAPEARPRQKRRGCSGAVLWLVMIVAVAAAVIYVIPRSQRFWNEFRAERAKNAPAPAELQEAVSAEPITWQEARRTNTITAYWRYVSGVSESDENYEAAITRTRARIRALGGRGTSRYMRASGSVRMRQVPTLRDAGVTTALRDVQLLAVMTTPGGVWYAYERRDEARWPFLFVPEEEIAPTPRN